MTLAAQGGTVHLVIRVSEDNQVGFREIIAWGATGRATRALPVYDLKLKKAAFLKDSWRSLLPGMPKESHSVTTR